MDGAFVEQLIRQSQQVGVGCLGVEDWGLGDGGWGLGVGIGDWVGDWGLGLEAA